jgi:hypothetical protein
VHDEKQGDDDEVLKRWQLSNDKENLMVVIFLTIITNNKRYWMKIYINNIYICSLYIYYHMIKMKLFWSLMK